MTSDTPDSLPEPLRPDAGEPPSIDLLAAALRADMTDLEIYERVLVASLADALPEGVLEVTRERSMGDRVAGRPGKVTALRAHLGDHDLELQAGRGGPKATVTRQVHGVAISRKEVSLEQWARILAEQLEQFAHDSAATREALRHLLGGS